jgi:hypothetical protein
VDGSLDPASANTTCANGSAGCSGPLNGSLLNTGNGSFNYTPNPNFNGSDSFVYEICDTLGACDTATVSITVAPVSDPPVANDDPANTTVDTRVTINVAANDADRMATGSRARATCPACVVCQRYVVSGNGTFTTRRT